MNRQQEKLKVILIGDTCIDEYHYGEVLRLSPEAPVPILSIDHIESKNGMASNVAENLRALGVEVISYFGNPSVKVRMIDKKSNQHLLRIDKDEKSDPLPLNTYFPNDVDAIVISDYEKGFVSYEMIEHMIDTGLPVFVDTKKTNLKRMNGAFVKINALEHNAAKSFPDNLIVTLGKNGAVYKDKTYPAPKVEIADVCGAGDTFLSALTYMFLKTKNIDDAIKFAVNAASITVMHMGVYAPSLKEII